MAPRRRPCSGGSSSAEPQIFEVEHTDEIVVGREHDGALFVGRPSRESDGGARIPIRIRGREIAAAGAIELEPWSGGIGRLPEYFDDLASNWRGWHGSKEWRDDSGAVEMTATHDRKAIVTLRVTMRDYAGSPNWQVEFDIHLEPGSLQSVADRVRSLVT
jgi:Family of unknown function (DUF6228)